MEGAGAWCIKTLACCLGGTLAGQGDEAAQAVLNEAARRTGQLCALLADIFSPEVIILGTLARHFGESWVEKVREEFRREGLEANRRRTRIVAGALGERLQYLSAIAPCVYWMREGLSPDSAVRN